VSTRKAYNAAYYIKHKVKLDARSVVRGAAYYIKHKAKVNAKHAAYADTHKAEKAARDAAYAATHKAEKAARGAVYYAARRAAGTTGHEAYRAANKAQISTRAAAYDAAHKSEKAARCRAYQARKLQRTPAWADPAKIAEWYEGAAFATEFFGKPYHVDHVIPMQGKRVSGLHVENNMQILSGADNCAKGIKHVY
jgi:hypothetical protein